ncbi:CRISPR-associated Cas4 family exonuclease [Fluviicoccus keumensis]|uniref:CRISPR-associated exonuclease Cas4 n=1 Tax=Fluviicoccus keumensis TaxID=1435465 RepID=A0A4Q7YN39_9GAMM|nr:CRISPR-associated protein Cas4 [Fluviicoccus keumensis]RZU38231.1 CRISPR-associated Cas4 family exonuclease [Fluviicoccus keumensis]
MNETLYLSRLQHYLYCPRQFALIELEGVWVENRFTAEGQVLHQKVNEREQVRRGNIRTVSALPLASESLGIEGIADVVEFHRDDDGPESAFPIEYKRGKPKSHRADEVQLCAQALCLEEMLGQSISAGALFYGETRRRQDVTFDQALRDLTLQAIDECRAIISTGQTPAPIYEPRKCRGCSLMDICQPQSLGRHVHVADWLARQVKED